MILRTPFELSIICQTNIKDYLFETVIKVCDLYIVQSTFQVLRRVNSRKKKEREKGKGLREIKRVKKTGQTSNGY